MRFLVGCAAQSWRMRNGGNQWSGWVSYLSFFDRVVGLNLPEHAAFRHYEAAAIHAGPRYVHARFWIASDFPSVLTRDVENRPHNEHGPFCRWSDGWALYAWHGVTVPAAWIEDRASLTPAVALGWPNVEQRRAACEIVGWDRILAELNARTIHADPDEEIGTLIEVDLPDAPGSRFLRVRCGTGRRFTLPVPETMQTARAANAWTYGLDDGSDYAPEVRT